MSARRHILRIIVAGLFLCGALPAWGQGGANGGGLAELRERALRDGTTRVIVQVGSRQAFRAEGRLPRAQGALQRNRMREARERVLNRAQAGRVVRRFESVPFVALEVDAATLDRLTADSEVSGIVADPLLAASLSDSVPLIEADVAHGMGLNGSGTTIAILDTGIDGTHPFLLGKVVEEACYAAGDRPNTGTCPNGSATQLGAGSAVPCAHPSGCFHGTHVAGIAAGSGASFTGVAPGANLIAIQVFHVSQLCAGSCVLAWGSDVLAGLERVYELRDEYAIAAVNMSLGSGLYAGCDDLEPAMTLAIDNLRAVGIATVVAAGNNGAANAIGFPACISGAVSVGATDDHDQVATFSNASPLLELFAPGVAINSSVTGGGFQSYSGTSMATPHVAGAWAVLRQGSPNATVDEVLATLVSTGRPVLDHRGSIPVTKPRIRLSGALGVNAPAPVIGQVSPTALPKWGSTSAITITGSGFVRGTYALVNGQQRPTTYVDASTLTASVLASDLVTSGSSLSVAVATPPPGGGTSSSVDIALLPSVVTFSTTVAEPGATVTVSWSGAPSGDYAWVALARVGAADTGFMSFAYLSSLSGNSWNVVMPTTTGDYEVRFYSDGTYTSRAFTAGPITVKEPPPPQGQASLGVSTTETTAGQAVTVTLTNGSGGATDWIALARVGTPTSSYVKWTYVGAGNTTFNWTVAMPTTSGDYVFRLFANGGATLVATSPTVTVTAPPPTGPAALSVGAASVTSGAPLTVTLTGGLGGATDWIALARVGAPATSYVQWTYVGAGNTTFNWTVSAPSTPAQYEFRLFANGGYTLIATSPTVTVTAPQPPPGGATLTASTPLAASGTPITVTLTGGSGGATDWLAFAKVGTPSSSYWSYTYVGSGVTTRTWTVTAPTTAGSYEFRLLPNNGYAVTATSAPVTVHVTEPPAPTLEVDRTTASPGESVTLTVTSSVSFGSTDWVGLARVGAPETAFLQYRYVGGGQTTFVWTVAMPSTFGDYEFRMYRNSGYTRVATSPTVSIQ